MRTVFTAKELLRSLSSMTTVLLRPAKMVNAQPDKGCFFATLAYEQTMTFALISTEAGTESALLKVSPSLFVDVPCHSSRQTLEHINVFVGFLRAEKLMESGPNIS